MSNEQLKNKKVTKEDWDFEINSNIDTIINESAIYFIGKTLIINKDDVKDLGNNEQVNLLSFYIKNIFETVLNDETIATSQNDDVIKTYDNIFKYKMKLFLKHHAEIRLDKIHSEFENLISGAHKDISKIVFKKNINYNTRSDFEAHYTKELDSIFYIKINEVLKNIEKTNVVDVRELKFDWRGVLANGAGLLFSSESSNPISLLKAPARVGGLISSLTSKRATKDSMREFKKSLYHDIQLRVIKTIDMYNQNIVKAIYDNKDTILSTYKGIAINILEASYPFKYTKYYIATGAIGLIAIVIFMLAHFTTILDQYFLYLQNITYSIQNSMNTTKENYYNLGD